MIESEHLGKELAAKSIATIDPGDSKSIRRSSRSRKSTERKRSARGQKISKDQQDLIKRYEKINNQEEISELSDSDLDIDYDDQA